MDKVQGSTQWKTEPKGFNKSKVNPKKGAVNVSTTQPLLPHPQQVEPQPVRSSNNERVQYNNGQGVSFQIKYVCPECSEAHYAFSCPRFKDKTSSQRKAYVNNHSLCY